MQSSNKPGKLVLPFAAIGSKNTIPVESQVGIVAGKASLADGFPPLTRTPLSAGGVPPSGLDMNGILYEMSAVIRWGNAGGGYAYDSDFANDVNVNGYPKGARVMRSDGEGYWLNVTENNTTDPEDVATGAGWVPDYTNGIATVAMAGSNVTLSPLQYGRPIIKITGTLTADLNLIFPNIANEWTVVNAATGSYSVTCKTASGLGVPVATGDIQGVASDGVDVFSTVPNSAAIKFIQAGTGAVTQYVRDVLREKVTPENFGAIGNGIADDTASLQAAINYAASSGRKLTFGGKNKIYKITTALVGLSNLAIDGNGATIDMSAIASGEKTAIVFAGSIGTGVAITGANTNNYTIGCSNTSSFSVGDYVQIASGDYYPYGGGAYNVAKGEIHRIRSIVANTSITFTTPLVDSYATAPKVYPITWVENVSIKGVKFVGLNTPATGQRGVALRYVKYFDVSENTFKSQDTYQVECASSIIGRINRNEFTGVFYDGVTGTIFYGITLVDCAQWVEVAGNIGDKVRHLVVTVSRTVGQGFYGQPYFINIHHNIAYDSMAGGGGRSYAYETHGFGRFILWDGNQAHGCYSGFNADGGEDIAFINNQITGYGYQGIIVGESGTKSKNITIANNTVDNYTGEVTSGLPSAIRLEVSDEMSNVVVQDNILTNCTSIASPNVGQAISIGTSTLMQGVLVKDNKMTTRLGIESAGTYAISTATGVKARFVDNEALGWRNGISVLGDKCQVEGGAFRNYAVGGTGFGFYSNSDRCICKNVHFENINTPIRLDTASTNNLTTLNTMTGCTVTTPSNLGTGNAVTGNYVV